MANRRYNTQVAQPRGADRVKRAGGGMGGRSGPMMYSRGQGVNMRSKRVPTELMDRGAMKKGGKVKGKHGYKKEGGKKGLSPKLEGAERLAAKKKQYRDMGFGDMMDKGELVIGREFGQMKKGGRVGKKKQGYKARKDESIAMRIKKKRTPEQLKASRDESYGKFGSKAKKSGKINK